MSLLDANSPTDVAMVKTHAAYLRETRTKVNELQTAIQALGAPLTLSVLNYSYEITDTCVLANAAGGNQSFLLPDAALMIPGVVYKTKKIDATENTVTLQAYGFATIDGQTSIVLTVPNEVVSLISDGVNLWQV